MPHREIMCIDPGVLVPELDSLNLMVRMSPIPISYHLPALVGMASIKAQEQRISKLSGIVILGSRSSVNDETPWQKALRQWLEKKIDASVPILGICFGHQLLAQMHGSKVFKGPQKLQGERTVQLIAESKLVQENSRARLVISHEEFVEDLPKDAQLLATSDRCPIDGLAFKHKPIWSFQPHVDATPIFAGLIHWSYPQDFSFQDGHSLLGKFLQFCSHF